MCVYFLSIKVRKDVQLVLQSNIKEFLLIPEPLHNTLCFLFIYLYFDRKEISSFIRRKTGPGEYNLKYMEGDSLTKHQRSSSSAAVLTSLPTWQNLINWKCIHKLNLWFLFSFHVLYQIL